MTIWGREGVIGTESSIQVCCLSIHNIQLNRLDYIIRWAAGWCWSGFALYSGWWSCLLWLDTYINWITHRFSSAKYEKMWERFLFILLNWISNSCGSTCIKVCSGNDGELQHYFILSCGVLTINCIVIRGCFISHQWISELLWLNVGITARAFLLR